MEEDRSSSEAVVLPDISEADGLPNSNEEDHENSGQPVTSASVVSVPVSLPVGSLIGVGSGGTTFNVITPEHLQVSIHPSLNNMEGSVFRSHPPLYRIDPLYAYFVVIILVVLIDFHNLIIISSLRI